MPVQVSFPGVYVQEVASGARTITGVSTSIAAFVGMAKQGPRDVPVQVLGFLDFTRTFSADISQGEMADQVRQFFTNGGQQAFVVRIGDDGLLEATADLTGVNGTTKIHLKAVSAGEDGNQLRVTVDYNTAFPERTFNLTVFRELVDASGVATRTTSELFKDLSMTAGDPKFVADVLNKNSALVTSTVDANDPSTSAGTDQGSSSTGLLTPTILNAFTTAIPTVGGQGKFRISVGGSPFRTVTFTRAGTDFTANQIQTTITAQTGFAVTVAVVNAPPSPLSPPTVDQFLRITSTTHEDVLIDPAGDSDIALKLGFGTNQGGIEQGALSAHRPPASGLVSTLGTDFSALLRFGESGKAGWSASPPAHLLIAGAVPLDILSNTVTFESGPSMLDGDVVPGHHLLNLRANLAAIAAEINVTPNAGWVAAVLANGPRLVLTPSTKLGGSSLIDGSFFDAGAPAGFADAGAIFDGTTVKSIAAATALENGQDGGAPLLGNYIDAFNIIDSQVDLFNILVLPRSADDTGRPRTDIWGEASSFALRRRAFLLIDPTSSDPVTIPDAVADVKGRRIGLVKDHAADYFPRLKVNPDGNTRFIDPSGSVAGVMARIDTNRGVWKAPAGLEADVRGVLGVQVNMSDAENGLLNPEAMNAIRLFPNGIVVWGARTMDGFDTSGDTDFKYVPVRRFESFIEESLVRGLKFAVFEPNAEPLWGQIRAAVGGFLQNLFRQGAFAGATAKESFFVKVDSETTTQTDINLGIVNVVVGFAPLKPAEFIVITIQQMAGQVQV